MLPRARGIKELLRVMGLSITSHVGYTIPIISNYAPKTHNFKTNKQSEIIVSVNSVGTCEEYVVSIKYKVRIYTVNH